MSSSFQNRDIFLWEIIAKQNYNDNTNQSFACPCGNKHFTIFMFLDFLTDLGQRMDRRLSARDFAGVRTVGDLVGILTGEVKPSSLVLGIRNKDHE